MRFAIVALLALASTVSAQFTITAPSVATSSPWLVSNTTVTATVNNGDINNVVVDKAMTITLTTTTDHPFGISFTSGGNFEDVVPVQSGGCVNGTAANTFTSSGTPCVLTITPPASLLAEQTSGTIFYKCFRHGSMVGRINLVAAAATTTVPPTTAGNATTVPPTTLPPTTQPPTTLPPTGTTAPPTADTSDFKYFITGANGVTDYTIATGTVGAAVANDPDLTVTTGTRVSFTITKALTLHPFGFTTTLNGTVTAISGVNFANCLTIPANTFTAISDTIPCVITMTAPAAGTQLWYRCSNHPSMTGRINVVAKSGASTLVMSFATIVLAAITAIIVA